MTQDKTPEWLTELAIETNMIVFDASVDLYEQGASGTDPQHVIALALSQAYERGQVDNRVAFTEWLRHWVKRRFGLWITHTTAKAAFHDYQDTIRSLPIEQEGGE